MISNEFPNAERIARLMEHARRAQRDGDLALARNLRRMARDLRPARIRRRAS